MIKLYDFGIFVKPQLKVISNPECSPCTGRCERCLLPSHLVTAD